MTYYLSLFTPDTFSKFQENGSSISGYRYRQRRVAKEEVRPGDFFVCYLVGLSRWCGLLEITSEAFEDDTPIFSKPDPFVIRFHVSPVVLLDAEHAVPVFEPRLWNKLSETRDLEIGAPGWAKYYRGSLRKLEDADGKLIASVLRAQAEKLEHFPFTERDKRQLARTRKVRTVDREVTVEVPEEENDSPLTSEAARAHETDSRQSIKVQAAVALVGVKMGFRIWVPRNDRARVLENIPDDSQSAFVSDLPLNYDDTTLKTIENIDVIWLKGRSMARAFEIEHTTAVYSGLLRMADLLALQPNMDIRLHIVAPDDKREKVLRELRRPVFSLLERGPLYESCTYLSYDAISSLEKLPYLSHTGDSILEEFEENAED